MSNFTTSAAPPRNPLLPPSRVPQRTVLEILREKRNQSQHQQQPQISSFSPATKSRKQKQQKIFRGPLLKCQEAIENCDPDLLKKYLLEYSSPDSNVVDEEYLVGELFAPSSSNNNNNHKEIQQSKHRERDFRNVSFDTTTTTTATTHYFHEHAPKTTLLHLALQVYEREQQIFHQKKPWLTNEKLKNIFHRRETQQYLTGSSNTSKTIASITVIEELILFGSPIWKRNSDGLTPCHLALTCCPQLLVPLLFKYGRNNDQGVQKENSSTILSEAKSFLRDVIAYSHPDEYADSIVGKFSPYRVEIVHGLFCLFAGNSNDHNINNNTNNGKSCDETSVVEFLKSADGTGKTVLDVLIEESKNKIPAEQVKHITTLLASPSPADERIFSSSSREQSSRFRRRSENSNNRMNEVEDDEENCEISEAVNHDGATTASASLAHSTTWARLFIHPLTRLSVIIFLLAIHFVLFLGDFYTRKRHNGSSNNTKTFSSLLVVGSQPVDLPFIFRVVEILGSNWISISNDILILNSNNNNNNSNSSNYDGQSGDEEEQKSFLTYLLVTRILCIVIGFVLGGLFFAFPVHLCFRDFFKWRMFGAEVVLGDAATTTIATTAKSKTHWSRRTKRDEDPTNPLPPSSLSPQQNEHDEEPEKEENQDENFSPATLRFFRESISQNYQPYTDPVTDISGPLQQYFTRRAIISSRLVRESTTSDVEKQELKPMINSRNRLYLFCVGAYVGLYCSCYVHDAFAESYDVPGSATSNSDYDYYPLSLSYSKNIPSFSRATMHLFHVTLYCLTILFFVLLDTMMQAIHLGPLFYPVINSHNFMPSRKMMRFASLFWSNHRVWISILWHVLILGGLAVFHYFDTIRTGEDDDFLIPVYYHDYDDVISNPTHFNLVHILVLLVFSTSCVFLDFVILMQEWNLPNLQMISIFFADRDNDNNNKNDPSSSSSSSSSSSLIAENSFALPCFSSSSKNKFGNVLSFFLFIWTINLTVDISRVYCFLKGSIDFLREAEEIGNLEWYHVIYFISALLPLVFSLIAFITLMIRNSTRIKIQHAFATSGDSDDTRTSCCTCCSDICCSCRNRNFFSNWCSSREDALAFSTSSGVRTFDIRNKNQKFHAISSSSATVMNNDFGDDDDDDAQIENEERNQRPKEDASHVTVQVENDRQYDGFSPVPPSPTTPARSPEIRFENEKEDEEYFNDQLSPHQKQAIANINAILASLRKPKEKDNETQTPAEFLQEHRGDDENDNTEQQRSSSRNEVVHAQEASQSHRSIAVGTSASSHRLQHQPQKKQTFAERALKSRLEEQRNNQENMNQRRQQHQQQNRHHLDPSSSSADIDVSSEPPQQQQEQYQHQQQQRPRFYSQEEIQFIDRTSQHYKNDYYERRKHQLKQEREQRDQEFSENKGRYYDSKPYQKISANNVVIQETEFMARGGDYDAGQFSVWEMALTNRVEALRLALIRDPSLVLYIGGPGLRCIEKDEFGNQINVACSFQQRLRVEHQRRQQSPQWDYSSVPTARHDHNHQYQHPNQNQQIEQGNTTEVYYAPGRNKKTTENNGDEELQQQQQQQPPPTPGSRNLSGLSTRNWSVSLLGDERQIEKAIQEDHQSRGGNGDLVDYGATLLHYAIFANCPAICSMLIANGADPTARCLSGQLTCIDLAFVMGRSQIGKRLENFAASIQMRK